MFSCFFPSEKLCFSCLDQIKEKENCASYWMQYKITKLWIVHAKKWCSLCTLNYVHISQPTRSSRKINKCASYLINEILPNYELYIFFHMGRNYALRLRVLCNNYVLRTCLSTRPVRGESKNCASYLINAIHLRQSMPSNRKLNILLLMVDIKRDKSQDENKAQWILAMMACIFGWRPVFVCAWCYN